MALLRCPNLLLADSSTASFPRVPWPRLLVPLQRCRAPRRVEPEVYVNRILHHRQVWRKDGVCCMRLPSAFVTENLCAKRLRVADGAPSEHFAVIGNGEGLDVIVQASLAQNYLERLGQSIQGIRGCQGRRCL